MAALPYERRDDETDPAWAAFVVYRDMGLERSLTKVSQATGKDRSLMEKWSSEAKKGHGWRKRVVAWDLDVDRRRRIGALEGVQDMRRRQIKLGMELQELGGLELSKLITKAKKHKRAGTLDDALVLKLVEVGSKLERVVRGEPGEIIETHSGDALDLSDVSLDDLKALRRVKAAVAARRAAAEEDENGTVH